MALETDVLPLVIPRSLPRLPAHEQGWPAQGEWTYEDYQRLPEDGRRYEIIEGVLYVTAAPGFDHQHAVTRLVVHMDRYVTEHHLGVVLAAPFEVHLPGIARPVQPDVLFIAAERVPQAGAGDFTGAPDLLVEVLSPSTVRTDRVVKFSAYERAGVREYWLVDPYAHSIEVYALSAGGTLEITGQYTYGEKIASTVPEGLALPVDDLFVEKKPGS